MASTHADRVHHTEPVKITVEVLEDSRTKMTVGLAEAVELLGETAEVTESAELTDGRFYGVVEAAYEDQEQAVGSIQAGLQALGVGEDDTR